MGRRGLFINIQYTGFHITATARVYDFQAVEHEQKNRQFVVTVRNTLFLATALKYQHGPEICRLRVQRALLEETTGAHASQKLEVVGTDVHEYFERGKSGRRPRANMRL